MRTRSDAARQRSLLKLPEDCIRHVALFMDCDVDAAQLALTSQRVMRSMTPTVWAQILRASHGGLKIAAADLDDGLRCAASGRRTGQQRARRWFLCPRHELWRRAIRPTAILGRRFISTRALAHLLLPI